jgi:hypothetical protein
MNRIIRFSILLCAAFVVACGDDAVEQKELKGNKRQEAITEIKRWEREMRNSAELSPLVADSALRAYKAFVTQFPEDSLSGGFVYKSAEIQTAIGRYDDALASYKLIPFKYPKFHLAPESLFQQASLLDNYMNKEGEARMIYMQVIEKYPGTNLAMDAKAAVQNLGKSDQELIEEFKKKNKEN